MRLIFFCFLLLVSFLVKSQGDVTLGKRFTIPSKILGEDREVFVYLPQSYADSPDTDYPVIFVLDAQWYFASAASVQIAAHSQNMLPEMIVVGIKSQNPQRYDWYSTDREKFMGFITKELHEFLVSDYRVSKDRLIFGWEAGAYFATYALFHENQYFNGAILSNGGGVDNEIKQSIETHAEDKDKYLFLANSEKDIYSIQYSGELAQQLEQSSPKGLKWKYEKFNDEVHESLAHLAMYHGLKYYYHNYPSLVFSGIDDFSKRGGLPFLKQYFQARGERFGFPKEIDASTKNALIWLAWNRNEFDAFGKFMKEFEDVLSTPRYASAYWQNRFGQFYLKHKDADNAIKFFDKGISKYPDEEYIAKMYAGLGKAHQMKSDKKLAKQYLKKAIDIASKNDEPELEQYRSALKAIK